MNGSSSFLHRADRFLDALRSRLPPPLSDARFRLRLQAGAAIALAASFLVYLLLFSNLLAPLHHTATDLLYHPITPNPALAIIAIDQKSLDEIGTFPWPRAIYAALLDRLQPASPQLIVFDLLFAQPSPDDSAFASAMQINGSVLLATTGVQAAAFPNEPNNPPVYDVVILPNGALRATAKAIGHRMVVPDADGIVRRIPLVIQANNVRYPALGLLAAAQSLKKGEIQYDLPGRRVIVGSANLPIDESGNTLLNFTSPNVGIPVYSFVDVFRGTIPASTFANKIVFVGGMSTIEAEDYAIPLQLGETRTHNVHLQADLANMILSQPPQTLQAQSALAQLALTLAVALIAGLTLPLLRLLYAVTLTLVYLVGLLLLVFEAFNRGVIVLWLYPALALLLTAFSITTYRYLSEERRRRFLTSLFRRYVPAESVGRVVDAVDRGELPLTGTRRSVTVLYADLRGFGSLSEDASPEEVLGIVNRYMELAMQAIQVEGGTVSKPMGDSLVAIWNAPLDQTDHQARGLRAAVNIRHNVARFQRRIAEEEKFNFGIGLATGSAIFGNISALGKVEYTLVGDTVNVAARISAFSNNNQILADSATAHEPPEGIIVRELSPVRVRGRKEPLPVWEVRAAEPLDEQDVEPEPE
jgi:adenylate cyclase